MALATWLLLLAAPKTWTLACGGDLMFNGIRAGTGSLKGIERLLGVADLAIVNLEIPFTTAKTPTVRKTKAELQNRTQFILKADSKHIADLTACGVDAVTLANNHALDYQTGGLTEMTSTLDGGQIRYAGAGANRATARAAVSLSTPAGVRVALLSFATFIGKKSLWRITPAGPASPGVAVLEFGGSVGPVARQEIAGIVAKARQAGDVVIVALHGGVERTPVPTSYQVGLGRAFVDAGADLVIGHHPHVLQGAELYRGKPILYSLGNLISPLPSTTALFHMRFDAGRLTTLTITPCKIAGSKTEPLKGRTATNARLAFNDLSKRLLRAFPNKLSRPLGSPYAASASSP